MKFLLLKEFLFSRANDLARGSKKVILGARHE